MDLDGAEEKKSTQAAVATGVGAAAVNTATAAEVSASTKMAVDASGKLIVRGIGSRLLTVGGVAGTAGLTIALTAIPTKAGASSYISPERYVALHNIQLQHVDPPQKFTDPSNLTEDDINDIRQRISERRAPPQDLVYQSFIQRPR